MRLDAKKQEDKSLKSELATPIDVRMLMVDIRERVKKKVGEAHDTRLPFAPQQTDSNKGPRKAGEILHSEELRYLNQNHAYSLSALRPEAIVSHRPIVGKLIVKVKRKILNFLWDGLFKPYFQSEKEFQSNLVRLLNNFAKYTDERDAFIFWDLIKKIDYDINKSLQRIERINDEQAATLINAEKRINETLNHALSKLTDLDTDIRGVDNKLEVLESVSRGLERIVTKISEAISEAKTDKDSTQREQTESKSDTKDKIATSPTTSPTTTPIDYSYMLLENRYRGSEDLISERLSYYVPHLKNSLGKVLEIGAGRGELQSLLKNSGVDAYGIEMDQAMVEACKDKGLNVSFGDGISHLEQLTDKSIGGVIAIQVIEHLTQDQLKRLVTACLSKIKPGGKVIFETINTESMVALASNYFRDPTHVFPLHPETMRFMLELLGLKVLSVNKLSPYGEEASLKEIEVTEFMTPRWGVTIETLNRNIRRLNKILYGHQDYCIIAEV